MSRRALLAAAVLALSCLAPSSGTRAAAAPPWRVAWAAAPGTSAASSEWLRHPVLEQLPTRADVTYRLVVRPTIGGTAIRLRLTNLKEPKGLRIAAATVGVRRGTAGASSLARLTFGGRRSVTVPADGAVRTDPLPMQVRPFQDLVVSLHVPTGALPTWHAQSYTTQYATPGGAGDLTRVTGGAAFTVQQEPVPWLDAVEVRSSVRRAVVAIGDSITDGDQAGGFDDALMERRATYPDVLARRVAAARGVQQASVVNEGINGDTTTGVLARLQHDVLDLAGVTDVVLEIGTNDLTRRAGAQAVIDNLTQITLVLHRHGIRVAAATLVPRGGTGDTEGIATVNAFIRHNPLFDDGVLDIHRVVAQDDTDQWRPGYDSGDFTHPSAAAYAAIARSLRLAFLRPVS